MNMNNFRRTEIGNPWLRETRTYRRQDLGLHEIDGDLHRNVPISFSTYED